MLEVPADQNVDLFVVFDGAEPKFAVMGSPGHVFVGSPYILRWR
jgi:hypothetical protein